MILINCKMECKIVKNTGIFKNIKNFLPNKVCVKVAKRPSRRIHNLK